MALLLGIDGGGTSCRAALATASGEIVGRGRGGPANIMTDLDGALASITAAAAAAFRDAGLDVSGIADVRAALGLAGTNVGGYKAALLKRLPFAKSVVESDALIALEGALGEHDGAIAILGTGSIFMAREAGRPRTIGGWGFVLSDLGGGARLGRDLLQETLLAHDDIRPPSPATRAVMERFGGDAREISKFGAASKPADFGMLAPLVFEHADDGDAVAARILATSAQAIDEALDALKLNPGSRLCLLGGLAPLWARHLAERHRERLHAPLSDALGGAVSMAVRHFGGKR
ncbi:MAG: BadF/BadG/BcrA/BcrD ATPase family protein [Rhizobiaceae bacterium]